ncbi:helix-turn-helix domain-containing protein [Candidatus Synechococcus calcipolaris G9]|uniref:Helix-turn-helix domain-containing protein n=1 Tax=Candidatus Synechococcus calcipolaris G9 TaxID=1497997 RepID=A0ABT6EW61_9SYNE|nr:helix-turn-helix transcriptional regulator [Candidatus Synechococcus calcipolaris]MDG2989496.1 helix-turn-helix domain-containing protein [Candidatus Synechococcus calcipolaris G9]
MAKIVKQARGNKSYRAYGRLLGVSGTTVQGWENLQYVPERENLVKIATDAGYTLEELIEYLDGEMPNPNFGAKEQALKYLRLLPRDELVQVLNESIKILAGV